MNTVCLIGRLSRAPTVRFETTGACTCTFTLAIEEKSQGGKPWTLYAPCVCYGRGAEAASVLNAEALVTLVGKLGWHKQRGKCGTEHSTMVVHVREVSVLQPVTVDEVAHVG
jgi:single-stranded DNA-binding protein